MSTPATCRPRTGRDGHRPHLAAGPAGAGRRGGHERLRPRGLPPARPARHRGRPVHPHDERHPARGRRGRAGRRRPARRRRALRGSVEGGPPGPALRLRGRDDARRGPRAAGLLRPRPLALLALRPGRLARRRPWGVPLVHTMHTMARVKNLHLADGDEPEPRGREIGEAQVVEAADRLVANTDREAESCRALRRRPGPRRRRRAGRRPHDVHAGLVAGARAAVGLPPMPWSSPSSAGSSRSRLPTSSSAPPPRSSVATRPCAPASSSPSSAVTAAPRALADGSAGPRRASWHRRPRALRPAGRPAHAGPVVPRGRRRRGPLAQRVLRPRRGRGAGLRHPRRRDERRGPPDRRRLRGVLVDGHDTAAWATALSGSPCVPPPRRPLPRRHRARRGLGWPHRRAARGSTPRDGPPARGVDQRRRLSRASPRRSSRDRPAAVTATVEAFLRESGPSGRSAPATRSTSSRCRGRRSSRPSSPSSSPTPGSRRRPSSCATPTRTTPRSTASSCAATCACRASPTRSTSRGTSTSPGSPPRPSRPTVRPAARGRPRRGRRAVQRLLVMGFITSMHKEWEWRVSRGESLRNLEAFRHLLERPGDPPPTD